MFEFLKRLKIRNRAGLQRSRLEGGNPGNPGRDSDPLDAVLLAVVTQEIFSTELSSHVDPGADVSPMDPGSTDTGSGFDAGGGDTDGGGASGDW